MFENTDHILSGESFKNVRHTDYDAKIKDSIEESSFLSDNKIHISSDNKSNTEETDIANNFAYFGESTSEEPRERYSTTENFVPSSAAPESLETPKVVVFGSNVLILDNSKPNPITLITVEDAVGLQRGVDENVDDSESYGIENHPLHIISDSSSTMETSTTEATASSTVESHQNDEPAVYAPSQDQETMGAIQHSPSPVEEELGSGSASGNGPITIPIPDDITDFSSGSGSGFGPITSLVTKLIPVSPDSAEFLEHHSSSIRPDVSGYGESSGDIFVSTEEPASPEVSSEIVHDTTFYESSSDASTEISQKPTESSETNHFTADELLPIHKPYIEDNEHQELINPGHGKLPDDLHIHSGNDDDVSHTRQLAAKKHDEVETPHAQPEPSKQSKLVELSYRSPGEPHLIPEWERNSTEEINTTEEPISTKLEKILSHTVNPLHADHSSSEEIDRKFNKDVEPTTTRYTPIKPVEVLSTEEDRESQTSNLTKETLDHEAEVLKIQEDPNMKKSDSNESSSSAESTTESNLDNIKLATTLN